MNKEKKNEIIYLQCCKVCETVEAAFKLDENPPFYPVHEEWMDECFGGENARQFENDENIEVQRIGYCSVECDIEDNGWPV